MEKTQAITNTPFNILNEEIGNIKNGVNIIAGYPQYGKSSFLMAYVDNWCRNGNRVFFNFPKASLKDFLLNLALSMSQVTSKDLLEGVIRCSQESCDKFKNSVKKIEDYCNTGKLYAICETDVDKCCRAIRKLAEENKIDVVAYDALNYCGSGNVNSSEAVAMYEYAVGALEMLAKDTGLPIFAKVTLAPGIRPSEEDPRVQRKWFLENAVPRSNSTILIDRFVKDKEFPYLYDAVVSVLKDGKMGNVYAPGEKAIHFKADMEKKTWHELCRCYQSAEIGR